MSDYSAVIFFQGEFTIDNAAQVLVARGLAVEREGDCLAAHRGASPRLHVILVQGDWVSQEAVEIAVSSPYEEYMAGCDRRFEIGFDNLDEVLAEANTLIEVQAALQNATQGVLYNSWNGQLVEPTT